MADEERIGVASAEELRDRGKVFYATPEWVEGKRALGYRFEASPPLYIEGRRRCLVLRESWDKAEVETIEVRSGDARSSGKKRSSSDEE